MARPERYDPDQWRYMNQPEVQQRIRESLGNYLRSFLDSAPEGSEILRVKEVFSILKQYFERELRLAEEDPETGAERTSVAETVLITLADAKRYLLTDAEQAEKLSAMNISMPPLSPEQLQEKAEEWRRFEERLRQQGKEHWWDGNIAPPPDA